MADDKEALVIRKRVEVFSAGCRTCQRTIEQLRETLGPEHELIVHEVHQSEAASARADAFGIRTLPAVAVNGELLACCRNSGPTLTELRAVGVARPLELHLEDH